MAILGGGWFPLWECCTQSMQKPKAGEAGTWAPGPYPSSCSCLGRAGSSTPHPTSTTSKLPRGAALPSSQPWASSCTASSKEHEEMSSRAESQPAAGMAQTQQPQEEWATGDSSVCTEGNGAGAEAMVQRLGESVCLFFL